ncbi:MAG TPA: integrase arm-type DNA-binding domain-containing protein [Candidatus Cybelea sp.]|nr:integrase arm-type DNA-binding domain-containing protein [Candidatus Cybelea sp.]
MPKRAAGLSARKVETLKTPGLFADGDGLYLQVGAAGARSWIFRYQLGGRRRDMGLGSVSDLPLADARERVREARRQVAAGVDPIDARKAAVAEKALAAAKATTFKEAAEAYIEAHRDAWKNAKHRDQWDATLARYAFPKIGALPAGSIDTGLVLKVLEPIWKSKTETANRLRGRLESILDFARVRGWRSGENPARWKGHLDHILAAPSEIAAHVHHAAMPYDELPAFWPRLQLYGGMAARALEFLILTAARTGEVLGATWAEIDLDKAVWTVPAERMKAGAEHRVPLSAPAVALLRKMQAVRTGDAVFPGGSTGGHLSNMAMLQVARRMKAKAVPHGFRSTFRDWAADRTNFPEAVAEAALAHMIDDKTIAAYKRTDFFDRRRKLMDAWAAFIEGGAASGRVVSIKRQR